jgi:hypothetical protein
VDSGLDIEMAKISNLFFQHTLLKNVHLASHERSLNLLEFYMLLEIEVCKVISEINVALFPCAEIISEGLNEYVGATHIELSTRQSAWITAAPTPIGSRAA